MISDVLAVYKFLKETVEDITVIEALFSYDGILVEGDEVIKIRLHGTPGQDRVWFYEVLPYEDYIFVPFPVNPAVYVDYGKQNGKENPNAKFFLGMLLARYLNIRKVERKT
ncbi:MAG: hypothetical protein WD231_00515 [Candidatus Woykebacteria bacterium]